MIKVASHIILSLLLLVSTTGLTISKHYCGGELVSTSVYTEADSCCDSGDCCKNETEIIQLDVDYSVSSTVVVPESVQTELMIFSLAVVKLNIEENTLPHVVVLSDSPPPPKIQTSLAARQTYLL